jgi:hypothetical protein
MAAIYPAPDPATIEPHGPYMVIGVYNENGKSLFMTEVIICSSTQMAATTFKTNNSWRSFSSIHVLPPVKL